MNVWCNLSTIFNQRRVLQLAGLLTLCVAFITTLFLASTTNAAPGVNQTVSFQGRLLTPQGQPVPEGYYNVQFKIYQDGTGTTAGNSGGTLEWTETHINNGGNNGIYVKNGYLSVDLGAKTPFGTSVDWNQDTLWLSMNIAGSSALCETFGTAPCLADGEMLPMKRLTSAPYALNSGMVGGKTASDLIHNGTSQQTANFNISGTGTASILQGTAGVSTPLLDTASAGTLSIGAAQATQISIGNENSVDQSISIGTGSANKTVSIGTTSNTSTLSLKGGAGGVNVLTSGDLEFGTTGGSADALHIANSGTTTVNLADSATFRVEDVNDITLFQVSDNMIYTGISTNLVVDGGAQFYSGLEAYGYASYTTPQGRSLNTVIKTPGGTVGANNSVFAFGLPAASSASAHGMLVADARTGTHAASIGVLSQNETQTLGFSWNGSNTTGYVTNTANSIALQGNGLDILTATNTSGQARVGIGNNASSGYALDVTGSTNVSNNYAINGVSVLSNSGLSFTAANEASVAAASGQALRLSGDGGVKVGDSTASGQPTLLTLDKASTTPSATGDAVLGSMYYDTTLGQVQCYEADGWGSCSASPDNFVNLSPEYSNAVTSDHASGTFTSGFCSDTLDMNNDTNGQYICNANETFNYYQWHSASVEETKDIFVTYQLPSSFTGFVEGSTSLTGRTIDTDSGVTYAVYKNTASGLVACGTAVTVADGTASTWNKVVATGSADPANCSFTSNDSLVVRISLTANGADAYAYASTLSFAFSEE